jgi:hypothetical protein
MRSNYDTRFASVRSLFHVTAFSAGTRALPLHVHVRQWACDGAVASMLVYVPASGEWFEGDDMPADVRAFALDALAVRMGRVPTFTDAAGVRP